MGRCALGRHILGYAVYLCPLKRTPGLYELISLLYTPNPLGPKEIYVDGWLVPQGKAPLTDHLITG